MIMKKVPKKREYLPMASLTVKIQCATDDFIFFVIVSCNYLHLFFIASYSNDALPCKFPPTTF